MLESRADIQQWIGRQQRETDQVVAAPLAALAATLDRDDPARGPGAEVPPLWHWMYFLPVHPLSAVGHDGHPKRGRFLPDVELPRRMWAESRLEFHHLLRVDDAAERVSTIRDVKPKHGRSGPLVFVRVEHEIFCGERLMIREQQGIVYRDMPALDVRPPAPPQAIEEAAWSREIVPDPIMLFRYSALTFNGHRIHYDRPYAMAEEGYPGLVVHGPLIATLLLDLLRRNLGEIGVRSFNFRAVSPLFDIEPFRVCGRPAEDGGVRLWAVNPRGELAMEASAQLAEDQA